MNKVCILMSTYNGKKYIDDQINSLLSQTDIDFFIFVRDDGSTDGTQKILEKYKGDKLDWFQGVNLGPAKSFLDLLCKAPDYPYYAFCDQDDVWQKDKLAKAVNLIKREILKNEKYIFYFSNVLVTDAELNVIKKSDVIGDVYSLNEALLHNKAVGCTVVINKELADVVNKYEPSYVAMHDWWIYLICLSLNGKIVFDNESYIYYRQHGNNSVGFENKKRTIKDKILKKVPCEASRSAKELLFGYKDILDKNTYNTIDIVANYKNNIKKKIQFILNDKFYRKKGIEKSKEILAIIRNRK